MNPGTFAFDFGDEELTRKLEQKVRECMKEVITNHYNEKVEKIEKEMFDNLTQILMSTHKEQQTFGMERELK